MSFPVKVWSGLIEKKHKEQIGRAIWLYLWFVVRVTREENGYGLVLGGKPIKIKEIADYLGDSYRKIQYDLGRLQKFAYLKTTRTPFGAVVYINKSKKFKWGYTQKQRSRVASSCRNKEDINDIKDNKRRYYVDVISHLNNKTNSKYKHTTGKNRRLIDARLNEGFKLEDFYTVINKKTKQWLGDKDMERYLRPETLFGTKFEGYLNEKEREPKRRSKWEKI